MVIRVKCSYLNCPRRSWLDPNHKFFSFPCDPKRADTWAENIGRPDLMGKKRTAVKGYAVCRDHFVNDSDYMNHLHDKLTKFAVPVRCETDVVQSRDPRPVVRMEGQVVTHGITLEDLRIPDDAAAAVAHSVTIAELESLMRQSLQPPLPIQPMPPPSVPPPPHSQSVTPPAPSPSASASEITNLEPDQEPLAPQPVPQSAAASLSGSTGRGRGTTSPNGPMHRRGLRNDGYSCFINSTLQSLFEIPSFSETIQQHAKECESNGCFSAELGILCRDLHSDGVSELTPEVILARRNNLGGKKFTGESQHDASVFLQAVICEMRASHPGEPAPYVSCLTGVMEVEGTCSTCSWKNTDEVPYSVLPLSVDGDIQTSLEHHFSPRQIQCSQCKKNTFLASKCPLLPNKTLILQIERFDKRGVKDTRAVYGRNKIVQRWNTVDGSVRELSYVLVASVNHQGGSADSGVYTASTHGPRRDFLYDNAKVSKSRRRSHANDAYILFYKLVDDRFKHSLPKTNASLPLPNPHGDDIAASKAPADSPEPQPSQVSRDVPATASDDSPHVPASAPELRPPQASTEEPRSPELQHIPDTPKGTGRRGTSSRATRTLFADPPHLEENPQRLKKIVQRKARKSRRRAILKEINMTQSEVTPRRSRMLDRYSQVCKELQRVKRKYEDLRTSMGNNEDDTLSAVRKLQDCLHPNVFELVMCQVENQHKKPRGRRFSLETKIFALTMYKAGPKAYRLLSHFLALPSTRTLTRLLNSMEFKPGINPQVREALRSMATSLSDPDKCCAVIFDEMALIEFLQYNEKLDYIEGFQDHGHLGRSRKVATQALTYMVKGLKKKWKQPYSYYFSRGATKATTLKELVELIVRDLFAIGLRPVVIVCDQGSANVSCLKSLGCTVENPTFKVDGHTVVALFDPPHLLKCIRNLLLQNDLHIGDDVIVRWLYILRFYLCDSKLAYRAAPVLEDIHFLLTGRLKMRVYLAAQVLSYSVASGFNLYLFNGNLPHEAKHTQHFVYMVDRLFDSLNGNSLLPDRPGKDLRSGIKDGSPHWEFWEEMLEYVKKWVFVDATGKPVRTPTPDSIRWTITAIKIIWEILRDVGYDYVLARALIQDCLENLFGQIRYGLGCAHQCTATQFTNGLKTCLVNRCFYNSVLSRGHNCKEDDADILADCRSFLTATPASQSATPSSDSSKRVTSTPSATTPSGPDVSSASIASSTTPVVAPELDETDILDGDAFSGLPRDIPFLPKNWCNLQTKSLAYIAGWLVNELYGKKTRTKCADCLRRQTTDELSDHLLFIQFKEYDDVTRRLRYPTEHFTVHVGLLFTKCEDFLRRKAHCENLVATMTDMLRGQLDLSAHFCDDHREESSNILLRFVCRIQVFWYCRKLNREFAKRRKTKAEAAAAAAKRKAAASSKQPQGSETEPLSKKSRLDGLLESAATRLPPALRTQVSRPGSSSYPDGASTSSGGAENLPSERGTPTLERHPDPGQTAALPQGCAAEIGGGRGVQPREAVLAARIFRTRTPVTSLPNTRQPNVSRKRTLENASACEGSSLQGIAPAPSRLTAGQPVVMQPESQQHANAVQGTRPQGVHRVALAPLRLAQPVTLQPAGSPLVPPIGAAVSGSAGSTRTGHTVETRIVTINGKTLKLLVMKKK